MTRLTLGEISINKGSYGIGAQAVECSPDLPLYLRITDIRDDGTLDLSNPKSVADPRARDYMLRENDIVFARTGSSTGRNYFYDPRDGRFAYAGFLIKFSINPQLVNPRYIKYYVQSEWYWDWIKSFNSGSTRGNINAKTYANLPIELPSRKTQDAIVDIADSISDKIRINSQINDHLLEYARTIFKKWLTSTHGNYAPIADVAEFNPDNYSPREQWPLVQYLDTGNITRGIVESYQVIDPQSERLPNRARRKITSGDIIYSSVRPVQEHYGLILNPAKNVLVSTGFTVIRANDRLVCPELLYLFLIQDSVTKTLQQIAEQSVSTYPSIKADDLGALQFPLPSAKETAELQPALKGIFGAIDSNRRESRQLAKLRDTLLPKFMSGEIDASKIDLKRLNGHLSDY